MKIWLFKIGCLIWISGYIALAKANISFEVTGVGKKAFPIAVTSFSGEAERNLEVSNIIRADLLSSGLFELINMNDIIPFPTEPAHISYPLAKTRGVQAQLIGKIIPMRHYYQIRFWLVDIANSKVLLGYERSVKPETLRWTAHEIADLVYHKLTGEVGSFATKIAFVVKNQASYQLQIADADGARAQTILSSDEPIISPRWSPDGSQLAYVSFERKKPIIFLQNMHSGKRQILAAFKGSNSAPAWSPDGKSLAIVLTQDGYSQIYMINRNGSNLRRLMVSSSIDTEPNFSPDGNTIIFTSDRGGSPQIYQVSVRGGTPTRLTYQGNYNTSAKFSPDGKSMILVHRSASGYAIALMDMATKQITVLSNGAHDDSPSFAPNGRMVLYGSGGLGQERLVIASPVVGMQKHTLAIKGRTYQPDWGRAARQ